MIDKPYNNRWRVSERFAEMTDKQIIDLMLSDKMIAKVHSVFSSASAQIVQACAQAKPPSITDIRRIEFDVVVKIAKALGVYL